MCAFKVQASESLEPETTRQHCTALSSSSAASEDEPVTGQKTKEGRLPTWAKRQLSSQYPFHQFSVAIEMIDWFKPENGTAPRLSWAFKLPWPSSRTGPTGSGKCLTETQQVQVQNMLSCLQRVHQPTDSLRFAWREQAHERM
jgi:hypothetical protein